jgi:transposase
MMIGGLSHLRPSGGLVPALPSSVLEPLWVQIAALLPVRQVDHLLGCHRPRIADRIVFDKLIQVLVFGCGYRRIADHTCSATTLRRRRDEWIRAGVAEQLRLLVLAAYDRMLGLSLEYLAVDSCTTKAPCGGQTAGPSPVDGASRASSARSRSRPAASHWRRCRPRPTTATTGCWPRPWTPWVRSGRCPPGLWCTWMPATTISRVGRSWPTARWPVRSPPAGCRPRSRLGAAG